MRKGQITIFVIVAIILLFSTAVVLFIQREARDQRISTTEEPQIAAIPASLEPIKKLVDTCIKSLAIDGLKGLGERGGYIDLGSAYMKDNGVRFRERPGKPTESDYIRFGGAESEWQIPYWGYMKSKNDLTDSCEFTSMQPPLRRNEQTVIPSEGSIEMQLDNFIEENLPVCVNNFDILRDRGFSVDEGKVTVRSTVAEHDVWFLVEYPLTVNHEQAVTEVREFFIKIPLELKRMYKAAAEITEKEFNHTFLAKNTLALITIFSGTGKNKLGNKLLPPMSGGTFSLSGGEIWTRTNVKNDLETMLMAYMNVFQIEGSKNFIVRQADPALRSARSITQVYRNMGLPINTNVKDFKIKFEYLAPFWPIYFDVNSDGELIKPDSIGGELLPIPLGLQNYNTVYDLSYPVKVELRSDSTVDFPDGYSFVFALESNLRNNEPFKCGNLVLRVVDNNRPAGGSLLCSPSQQTSNISVKVIDRTTGQPADGVSIVQDVAGTNCGLGETIGGEVKAAISPGYGVMLGVTSGDYIKQSFPVDIDEGESLTLDPFEITPIKTVRFKVSKLLLNQFMQSSGEVPLDKKDQVTLLFNRIKSSDFEDDFDTAAFVIGPNETEIRIAPGDYIVEGNLVVGREVFIPEKRKKAGSGIFASKYTVPSVTLPDPHPWGGVKFSRFTIDPIHLDDGVLEMRVFEFPEPSDVDHLDVIQQVEQFSKLLKSGLLPR